MNIESLLAAIDGEFAAHAIDGEVVVVDDDSTDGTPEAVRRFSAKTPVTLLQRKPDGGLVGAVLAGAAAARADVVVVMDADLSHPADRIMTLAKPVLAGSHDIAIGSRYVSGGK